MSLQSSSEFLLRAQTLSCVLDDDPAVHINVGSFYEIDHSNLPPKSPDQLKSIRVVMVNEKTRMRVSLRFPSVYSVRDYCNAKSDAKKLPSLDEKYIMGSEIAAEALYRRIPPQEIAQKKNLWSFWVVPSVSITKPLTSSPSISRSRSCVVSKKGCLSQLEDTGFVKWGQRRQVRYLARHKGNSVNVTAGIEAKQEEEEAEEEEHDRDSDENEIENADEEKEIGERKTGRRGKRKQLQRSCKVIQAKKKAKRETANQIVAYKHKKKKALKISIARWSAERYKLAEVNMLKIMQEQGAVFGRPILRPELRAQARKLIGDTGLLDHLLKHMSGKVAPGGELRFRRRHNAEGAMEYWLENADLVDIRRDAGVQDPYWTPPPGWSPGDNPTQDPICARQIKSLKEEFSKFKRDIEIMVSKANEEEQAILTTPISSITGCNIEHEDFVTPLKTMYIDLMNKKTEIDRQLVEISQSLIQMEEERERIKAKLGESKTSEAALIALPGLAPTATDIDRKEAANQRKKTLANEEKAAKIERLKSGFRICKPQGTFLWPNKDISSPQIVVQFENMFSVPTPPSVSSTTAKHTQLLPSPPSPVKPLAVLRPLSQSNNSAEITNGSPKNSMINLNEIPTIQNGNGIQSQDQNSSFPVTCQRRNHTVTTNDNSATSSLETEEKAVNQLEPGHVAGSGEF